MSETSPTTTPLLSSTYGLRILGFGFARMKSNDPWFTQHDLAAAWPTEPHLRYFLPEGRSYDWGVNELDERGLILDKGLEESTDRGSQRVISIVREAEDVMIDNLINNLTRRGTTLYRDLIIPDVVTAVLEGSNFKDRLLREVIGSFDEI